MTPEQLKASILQYAIQGKLVEQRAEEGNAEELYTQIQAEKQQLIKDGKIKKSKPLPPISEDEIPFDIPDNWKWVRVGDIGYTQTGNTPKRVHTEYFGSFIPFIGPSDIQNGIVDYYNQGLSEQGEKVGRIAVATSILQVCIGGSIGKCALVDRNVAFNQQLNSLTPIKSNPRYIFYMLNSTYFIDYIYKLAGGTATPIINRGLWDTILIPLPPLAEQKRIVEKIEQLLPLVDIYAKAYEKLEQLNTKFPDEMKKAILQYAIQGKLVEQRAEEGNAEELYKQIQAEKQQLIKDGKIKKSKPLLPISADEIPFDIPDTWKWVRVGDIGSWASGSTPSRTNPLYYGGSIPWLKTGDLNDGIIYEVPEYITELALEKTSVKLNPRGSVLMAMYGATIGKLGVLDIPMTTNQACCACCVFSEVYNYYLFYFLMSQRLSYIGMAEGGAQPNISKEKIVSSIIPLPPLAEQKRIVEKIEQLLPLCDKLK